MAKNVAKGNARVGMQIGGGTRETRDERGNKQVRVTDGSGRTAVTTYVKKGPNHPDGPGVTELFWHE